MKALRFLLLCTVSYLPIISQTILIENINIIDVENGKIKEQQYLLIEKKKISSITSKKIIPQEKNKCTIIDGTGKFMIPGMIDTHIHFFQTGGLYTRPDAIDLTKVVPYEDEIQFAKNMVPDSFRRYLRLGITSIMDVGGPFYNFIIRDSIAKNHPSPNVFVTGPLFSPYQPEAFSDLDDVPIAKMTTKEEATKLFNKMLPHAPDFIKIWYIATETNPAEENYELVAHIAKLCRNHGLKLTVHATQLNTAKLAVEAGADILVHSIEDQVIDDIFLNILKEKNVTYIPTLIVSNNYIKTFLSETKVHPQDLRFGNARVLGSLSDIKHISETLIPDRIKNLRNNNERRQQAKIRYKKDDSIMAINLKKLQQKGVNIATGTDAGNIGTLHASSYIQEMETMQEMGMSIPDIIKSSTINAAKAFGIDNTIGSIHEGKLADLVILGKNPLEGLKNLNSIEKVIKSGQVLDITTLIEESPEEIVQRQLNAYNARDIDAFMETYTNDIKLYDFPEKISIDGKESMRKRYANMFDNNPTLHCKILKRIVLGNKVIDHEYVTFQKNNIEAIAIYETKNGKISKVTFLR